jgi:pimeloyl-ACP methyl ester carboxylesterase
MRRLVVRRAFVDTPAGQIHYATAGEGKAVLLLHQTPRSWDEYREVLPIIGQKYRAVAMDTVGFGDSYKPRQRGSIELYAQGVLNLLDALGIEQSSLVGHHTGGVIAVEVSAGHPERVDKLVLSSTPYLDAEERERRKHRPPVDEVEVKEDGSHLTELWRKRMPFYPKNRPDLLSRFVRDALKVLPQLEDGHRAVSEYRMEERLPSINAPTLVLAGSDDPFASAGLDVLAERIRGSLRKVIEGGMVPMVDQMPEKFAEAVLGFLDNNC